MFIAGVDEAGRGPWAGPVVAAAVILDVESIPEGICDSKKLSAKKRMSLFEEIKKSSIAYSIAVASVEEIDNLNILNATLLAMTRAVDGLSTKPDIVLVDGNVCPKFLYKSEAIIRGDDKIVQISAASILAKVYRDLLMAQLHTEFAIYGWDKNAGYGTKLHQEGLKKSGVTVHHRRSFKPIMNFISVE